MTRRPLTDGEIAEALLRGTAPHDGEGGGPCDHEDRLWDLARGALSPDQAASILDHSLECPDCSLALRVAYETFAASGLPSESTVEQSAWSRVWSLLAGSVLSPKPALAYLLLLLVLSFPLYRSLSTPLPAPAPAPTVVPPPVREEPALRGLRVLRLTGDISLRGAGGGAAPTPARVLLGDGEALVLKLFPDAEDLPKEPGAVIVIRVLDGPTVVSETVRRVSDLDADQSLSLLVDRDALRPGRPYVAELAPSGGQPILRQTFLWERH